MDESVSFIARSVVQGATLSRLKYGGKGFSAGYGFR